MRKIFIDKSESAVAVVERVIAEADPDIIIVIPRNARFSESPANFHLLKREAEGFGKHIMVESVDEEVLALAKSAKIPASHPLFTPASSRFLSDIVPAAPEEEKPVKRAPSAKDKKRPSEGAGRRLVLKPEAHEETPAEEETTIEIPAPSGGIFSSRSPLREEEPALPKRGLSRRVFVLGFAVLGIAVLVGVGGWAVGAWWGRAEIKINFAEVAWENQLEILATKTAAEVKSDDRILPAEVFRDKRNLTQFFPAAGVARVAEKAKGRLTIYNAYSSEPQILVANTRFETPDGKIFRLDNQVVVPGAQIKDVKIVPASIETGVTADKAGEEYNVGPVAKLTIPGFKGSPRFQGFYGALLQGASGGFVGEKAVPTDADIAAAKEKMTAILKSSLESNLLSGRPAEFKILPGASEIEVTRMTVNKTTDDKGKFSIIGEAEFRAVGFREADLRKLLLDIARREYPDMDFKKLEIDYGGVQLAYAKGEVRFSVRARGELNPAFSPEDFKVQIAGEDLNSVRSRILKLPRLADAEVSVWPIWLRHLPTNPDRISVNLE